MKNQILVNTHLGKFWTWEEDLITEQLIEFGAHTRNELSMVMDHIDSDDVVIDLGAHIGTFTIPIAKKLGRGKVYAVESDLDNFELLSLNVAENKLISKCELFQFLAIGMHNTPRRAYGKEKNSGANYYLEDFAKATEINATNLATWVADYNIENISFIKLDVEGMEFELLTSILHILERDRPKLYIEIVKDQLMRNSSSPERIQDLLDPLGYKYFINTGERNSFTDDYTKKEIFDLAYSPFFDVLALPSH